MLPCSQYVCYQIRINDLVIHCSIETIEANQAAGLSGSCSKGAMSCIDLFQLWT